MQNNIRSQSLDLLRFPLAIVVLSLHVFSTTGVMLNGSIVQTQLLPDVQCIVDVFLRGQSVPIYYFISGYVFFLGIELTLSKYLDKLRNRVKTLLIPYFVWNIIAILITIGVAYVAFNGVASKYSLDLSITNIMNCFWDYDGGLVGKNISYGIPIQGPTWFLRDLMVIVIFTPILNKLLVGKFGIVSICLFAILWLYSNLFGVSVYMPSSALFFFSLGAFMSINRMDMIQTFGSANFVSVILYTVLSVFLYILHNSDLTLLYSGLKSINIFIGLIVLFNLSVYLLKNGYCKVNKLLASSSLFIYISHILICGRILKLIFVVIEPQSQVAIFACYIATIFITLILLMSIFIIMKRYTPKLLTFITGRK